MFKRAIDVRVIQLRHDAVFEFVAESGQANGFVGHFRFGDFASLTKSHDARHVERTGTHAAFVTAAVNYTGQFHSRIFSADVQCTDAFRPVKFMCRNGHDVDVH